MQTITQSALLALLSYVVYKLCRVLYVVFVAPMFSPLRDLPGPKRTNFIYGNMGDIIAADPGELHSRWITEHGHAMKYKAFFNADRFFTQDTRALQHILSHADEFQKPDQVRSNLAHVLGEGVLIAEGEAHRRQRRVLNPAFSNQHIRELTDIFLTKSLELRDVWLSQISDAPSQDGTVHLNVLKWLSKTTLDIIGLAGFDYNFNATNPEAKRDDMSAAFQTAFQSGQAFTWFTMLSNRFPILRMIPTAREKKVKEARQTMKRIGMKLINEKKRAILEANEGLGGKVEGKSVEGKDLLSLLIRANMATDLPESARLNDDDVLAQVPTFLVAGHETTATATTWFLYGMTQYPEVQKKLREELQAVDTDTPSMDVLNSLPYLDAVVRESLRFYAIVPSTIRIAMQDTAIPLGTPVKDKKGRILHEVRLNKGDGVLIPIISLNTSKEIWGDDADQFRPERWEKVPDSAHEIPGVWGDLMTFLGGPRSCIGYKFAIIEMKALVFTLVRAFAFEMSDPSYEIVKRSAIVTRPLVKSQMEKGNQMPLKVTAIGS
ncbi:cytochrome P450 [Sistotremastrum niveocremeum HHB9708]|uniref:Cytochrome P450 n=1 Tax=Sistotremastrum niveocremeum HHB9708 TaxID=1314777 RepID=A0A164Y8H3_9AGAM|nr:cytochrome P450 [Sistotremastrum niveocremeum HHB9708]